MDNWIIQSFNFTTGELTGANAWKRTYAVCRNMAVFRSCIVGGIVLMNILLVMIYCRMERTHRKEMTNITLLYQSIIYLVNGATAIPIILVNFGRLPRIHDAATLLSFSFFTAGGYFCNGYVAFLCTGGLILCTMERLIVLKKPLYHFAHITKAKMIYAALFIMSVSALPIIIGVAAYALMATNRLDKFYLYFLEITAAFLLIVILTVFILLSLIFHEIKKQASQTENISPINYVTNDYTVSIVTSQLGKEREAFKTFTAISLVFTFAYLPHTIGSLIYYTTLFPNKHYDFKELDFVIPFEVTSTVFLLFSFINPILIVCMKTDYRNVLQRWLPDKSPPDERPADKDVLFVDTTM